MVSARLRIGCSSSSSTRLHLTWAPRARNTLQAHSGYRWWQQGFLARGQQPNDILLHNRWLQRLHNEKTLSEGTNVPGALSRRYARGTNKSNLLDLLYHHCCGSSLLGTGRSVRNSSGMQTLVHSLLPSSWSMPDMAFMALCSLWINETRKKGQRNHHWWSWVPRLNLPALQRQRVDQYYLINHGRSVTKVLCCIT